MQIIRAITISTLLATTALAQGFPWDIFKPRTLKEVISTTTKAVRPDDSMFLAHNQLASKVEVVFTGKSRPIIKARKTFIDTWFGTLRPDQKKLAELYEREYLYKAYEVTRKLEMDSDMTSDSERIVAEQLRGIEARL